MSDKDQIENVQKLKTELRAAKMEAVKFRAEADYAAEIMRCLAAPPVTLPDDGAMAWIRRVIVPFFNKNGRFLAKRYAENPEIVGVCAVCDCNLWGNPAEPGLMPCGVGGCPYEIARPMSDEEIEIFRELAANPKVTV